MILQLLAGLMAVVNAPQLEAPLPHINYIFPAGGQRGQTVEVAVTGTNVAVLSAANSVLVSGSGVTGKVIEAKDPNKARYSITISPNAELGERELRVQTPGGISNHFRFIVGQFAEINEVEPNSEKAKPQVLASLPITVNGQITDSDRDYFRFHAKAGQTLVCEVLARALLPFIADAVPGWFDPILTLYDASGKEVRSADDFRFHPDPVLFFSVPKEGDYTLELRDVIYRGRGDFIYRLTIGEIPYLTHIYPLGGRRGSEADIELHGANLPTNSKHIKISGDAPHRMTINIENNGIVSNSLPFATSDVEEARETSGHNSREQAQRVSFPSVVNGRIAQVGESDFYAFSAKAGDKLVAEVEARRLDSPVDTIVTLYDSKGAVLAENDDTNDPLEALITHHSDSRVAFTISANGDYTLGIRDVTNAGGEVYAYRLAITAAKPDFALRINPDNPRVGQGDTTAITVTAIRKDGLTAEIALAVDGLPAGWTPSAASIPAGQDTGRLTITAPAGAPLDVFVPIIRGTATVGKETITRKAEATDTMQQAFAYMHNITVKQLSLAVVKEDAYTLSADVPRGQSLPIKQDADFPIVVKIHRKKGAQGPVSFIAARPAPGITVKPAFAAPDKDEATLVVTVTKEAKVGLKQNLIISGVMRAGKENITRYVEAVPIEVVP